MDSVAAAPGDAREVVGVAYRNVWQTSEAEGMEHSQGEARRMGAAAEAVHAVGEQEGAALGGSLGEGPETGMADTRSVADNHIENIGHIDNRFQSQ